MKNTTHTSAANAQEITINPNLVYLVLGIIGIVSLAFMTAFGNNLG
ncbi:MAG: hypothetical protein KBC42_02205 [Candidatus Pacebacteria bacterium]|jgi:hypothetical protein|nr:hypothetical protein [Candidatus Paceibacterota bacterium]MBP9780716.1 hypothetical protein [Candidatus Paceibacterota bacterium]